MNFLFDAEVLLNWCKIRQKATIFVRPKVTIHVRMSKTVQFD